VAAFDQNAAGHDEELVLGRAGERKAQPAARTQDPSGFRERAFAVGHQHVDIATHDGVNAAVRKVELLGVHDRVLHVRKAELLAAPPRSGDHRRRKIGQDQPAAVTERSRRTETGFAVPGRKLEHRLALLRPQPPE
jgi:hypothetical protein